MSFGLRSQTLRKADAIYLDEIRKAGPYDAIWQAFAVRLPVQTVGVMGDYRSYDFVLAPRAVTSTDGMTADFYPFDMTFLGCAATRIINEVKGVNRCPFRGRPRWPNMSVAFIVSILARQRFSSSTT